MTKADLIDEVSRLAELTRKDSEVIVETMQAALKGRGETSIDGFSPDDGVKAVLHGVDLYKPVIAAVNGSCVGGGMVLLSSCDLRIAADTATFGVMEAKRGLFAGGGTTVRLGRQLPFPAAMELLLCADLVSAHRVYDMGLLNEVCAPGDLLERAYDYAHRITANGPFAVRKTKGVGAAGPRHRHGGGLRHRVVHLRPGLLQRGRRRGAEGLRREAPSGLEEPLSRPPAALRRGRGRWPGS